MRHAEIADLPIGRNPEETVRLVQAFKFADEHGEVSASLLLHCHAMRPVSRAAPPAPSAACPEAHRLPGLPRFMEAWKGDDEGGPQGEPGVLQDAAAVIQFDAVRTAGDAGTMGLVVGCKSCTRPNTMCANANK